MRVAWRRAMNEMRGAYSAGDMDRRAEGWNPVNGTAEQLNQPQRDLIRSRARERERNSDMLESILLALERNVVGTGFRLQSKAVKSDGSPADDVRRKLEVAFKSWQKKQNCDITGQQSFWEMQKMALRRTKVDGGILFVKTYTGNKRFPFQLQAREVDDLDSNGLIRNPATGNIIINGVEVNQYSRPVAYWLKEYTPDGWYTGRSKRIEAQQVIVLWKKKRPTQVREVSDLAPAIMRINDVEELIDSVSMKEKILSALAIFIKRALPNSGRGLTSVPSSDYDPKTGYKKKRISPGMITDLQPGDDVTSVIPTGQAANTRDFSGLMQRLIGAGQGLSYEAASRDMSQVNYSSARQGLLEDQKTYEDWQQWLIDHFLSEVYTEFVISAVLSGEVKTPGFWQNKDSYLDHEWIAPGWGWIDPKKEVEANTSAINSGQDNLANICARAGYDWRDVLKQRAEELAYVKQLEEEYGVKLSLGGEPVAEQQQAGEESAEGGDDSKPRRNN